MSHLNRRRNISFKEVLKREELEIEEEGEIFVDFWLRFGREMEDEY
jgi:hypothetical protein